MVERLVRNEKVRGSTPLGSTNHLINIATPPRFWFLRGTLKYRFAKLAATLLALSLITPGFAKESGADDAAVKDFRAPKDAVILVIRHAEKPDQGTGLSPAGRQRAVAYVSYFRKFTVDSKPIAFDALYATADSKASNRPRRTLEPLAVSLRLSIRDQFSNKDFDKLAAHIASKHHEKQILICWHHGEIPALLGALGADPAKILPNGKWPSEEFGWVVQLRYDHEGKLLPDGATLIPENIKLTP